MKLTRRDLLKVTGAAALAGCAPSEELLPEEYEEDAGPDKMYDALPADDKGSLDDASLDDASLDADPGTLDAALPEDTGADPSRDAGTARDAGAAIDVPAARDTGTARDTGAAIDTGPPPRSFEFQDLPQRDAQFPLGVMAGDADATSLMFWTRYEGTAPLVLRVLEMDGSRIVAVRFDGRVSPSGGGFVRVIVNGLRSNRVHRYAFLVAPSGTPTGRSLIGRARTAFADDTRAPITFAGTACTNQNHRPFPALVHAGGRTDLDFFVHLGDHVYTDHGTASESLGEYRAKYEANWTSAGLRALHRSTGMYLTWDDHEVRNNWDPEHFPRSRLAFARQTFFEHRATRRNSAHPDRIWRKFRWGHTAEIFVLDCRSERLPSTRSTTPARESTYISRAQMDWLKSGLRASPAVFKFIMNSVPIYARPGGLESDNWIGYPSQRREILNFISNNSLRGVVWLSGDIHVGGIVSADPPNDAWEIIMGPGGADRRDDPDLNPLRWPVFVGDRHNYTVVRADPMARTLNVEFIGENGMRIPNSAWSQRF